MSRELGVRSLAIGDPLAATSGLRFQPVIDTRGLYVALPVAAGDAATGAAAEGLRMTAVVGMRLPRGAVDDNTVRCAMLTRLWTVVWGGKVCMEEWGSEAEAAAAAAEAIMERRAEGGEAREARGRPLASPVETAGCGEGGTGVSAQGAASADAGEESTSAPAGEGKASAPEVGSVEGTCCRGGRVRPGKDLRRLAVDVAMNGAEPTRRTPAGIGAMDARRTGPVRNGGDTIVGNDTGVDGRYTVSAAVCTRARKATRCRLDAMARTAPAAFGASIWTQNATKMKATRP